MMNMTTQEPEIEEVIELPVLRPAKRVNKKCPHGRNKYYCPDCEGPGVCIHRKRKAYCRECGGFGFCKHGRQKHQCVECGGGSICEHKRLRSQCRQCDGAIFCKHGHRRCVCVACDGSGICVHMKRKSACKLCGGSAICTHGRNRWNCGDCGTAPHCITPGCETWASNALYEGYCRACVIHMRPDITVKRNYKTKELDVFDRICEHFPGVTAIGDRIIYGGCSRYRPDILIHMGDHVVVIEIDENRHSTYNKNCEEARLNDLFTDAGDLPMALIRFNPDGYKDETGARVKSCWKADGNGIMVVPNEKKVEWEERMGCLFDKISYWLDTVPSEPLAVEELFFGISD